MKVHPSIAKKPFSTPHGPKSFPSRSGDKAWLSPPYVTSLFNLIVFSTHLSVHIFMLFSAAWLAVCLVMLNLPAQALSVKTHPIIPVVWYQPSLSLYPMLLFSRPILLSWTPDPTDSEQEVHERCENCHPPRKLSIYSLPVLRITVWGHTDKAQGSAVDHRELTCSVFTVLAHKIITSWHQIHQVHLIALPKARSLSKEKSLFLQIAEKHPIKNFLKSWHWP